MTRDVTALAVTRAAIVVNVLGALTIRLMAVRVNAMTAGLVITLLLVSVSPATGRTVELRYTPFAADGSLRDGVRATPQFGGSCATGSFLVAGPSAFRCTSATHIYDPCYLDPKASTMERSVMVCVTAPWSRNVLRLRVRGPLSGGAAAAPTGPPWALRLASGRLCLLVGGAASIVGGQRMNYACGERYLFGVPDTMRPTWRIRQARTPGGSGMRQVAIATAWR
ncbi:MAG: hypothetical protein ACXVRN_02855 [Solirubrobacteraceae bacterium]